MADDRTAEAYLTKAEESLASAESDFAAGRSNSCANRAYYACFQAAIAALLRAGSRPPGRGDQWGHDFVQAQFAGQFINRRKRYPTSLRDTLVHVYRLRVTADYKADHVTALQASRGLSRAREFVGAIRRSGEEQR